MKLLLVVAYLAFISLGLPDALLGSAWPLMVGEFAVPVSWMGGISMIIAFGTIVSSLQADRLTARYGTGRVTAGSVALTAVSLWGFSVSHSYGALCLWAIPYGLGAGCVDASLNNYVALHFAASHMNWLHCMWGVGASLGPYLMNRSLLQGYSWNRGYRIVSLLQLSLTVLLFLSLPLWQDDHSGGTDGKPAETLSLREVLAIPGAAENMVVFFCYCAIEATAGSWAASYLVLHEGMAEETAAGYAALFYLGITAGRAVDGFLTRWLNDHQLIGLGTGLIALGLAVLIVPVWQDSALAGFVLAGLGCAPVYPAIIHATPRHFGPEHSQALIGVQMASAYTGTLLMPALFGFCTRIFGIGLLPWYLAALLLLLVIMFRRVIQKTASRFSA